MNELQFHYALMTFVWVVGAVSAVALLRLNAPYGRFSRSGWGPTVSSRAGWVLMEAPSLLVYVGTHALGPRALDPVALAFACLWILHYGDRAWFYPKRMYPNGGRAMPLSVIAMGATFNVINAYLNARWFTALGPVYELSWLVDPRFLVGVVLFVVGFVVNRWADGVLRRLRAESQGYRVPHRGLYRWVASPNYLGELLEWSAFALATWSLPGLTFAVFTACNLVPRALSHRRWYAQTFPDYPKTRRAIIPFVL